MVSAPRARDWLQTINYKFTIVYVRSVALILISIIILNVCMTLQSYFGGMFEPLWHSVKTYGFLGPLFVPFAVCCDPFWSQDRTLLKSLYTITNDIFNKVSRDLHEYRTTAPCRFRSVITFSTELKVLVQLLTNHGNFTFPSSCFTGFVLDATR